MWFTDPTYGIETDFQGSKAPADSRPAVFCAGDGVHGHAPDGTPLGCIHAPATVSNLCFGRELARLFLCAAPTLLAIEINMRGMALV